MDQQTIKQRLREKICAERLAIPLELREVAAKKLWQIVTNLTIFRQAEHIALYWPYNAEINPLPILEQAIAMHKYCYLPVLHPEQENILLFMPYHAKTTLRLNKYGIPEPDHGYEQAVSIAQLSIIFIPLVAFDKYGHRLGMGGGYYDTTLAKLHDLPMQPICIGLGYAMQEIAVLPYDHWDFTLDGVITENECKVFNKAKLNLLSAS
jgi:5-formyltetrahydrofolate cyclo-ligase